MMTLFKKYPQLLIFGILTAMFSSPGQTFLVSLFILPMRETFGWSQAFLSSLYSCATLVSAFVLPFTGRLLDRMNLSRFAFFSGLLLALGCFTLSRSQGAASVFLGFLLVRNLGQGTLTMISSTTMARVFGHMRGKALSIANMGYPLSEAIFPYMITSWIAVHGWRSGWVLMALLTLAFFSPAVFFLLRTEPHKSAEAEFMRQAKEHERLLKREGISFVVRDWTVREILLDWRFYFLMIALSLPPAFLTALFFHQETLIAVWKGWSLSLIALGFVAYALVRGIISFVSGPLVDKFSAKRVFPWSLFPLGLGMVALLFGNEPIWCFLYLIGAGTAMGFAITVSGALLAEFYGVKYLGSIRGVTSSLIVFSTAVSPPVIGALLDHQVSPFFIIQSMLGLFVFGNFCAWLACRE